MLRFKGTDLRPILQEAKTNGCKVLLIKNQNHGVYMVSAIGEPDSFGGNKKVAYALGCNPNVDDLDAWRDTAMSEFGGDDFAKNFEITEPMLEAVLNGTDDLLVSATKTHIQLESATPLPLACRHPKLLWRWRNGSARSSYFHPGRYIAMTNKGGWKYWLIVLLGVALAIAYFLPRQM